MRPLVACLLLIVLAGCASLPPPRPRTDAAVVDRAGPLYRQAYLAIDDRTFEPPLGVSGWPQWMRSSLPDRPTEPSAPAGVVVQPLPVAIRATVPLAIQVLEALLPVDANSRRLEAGFTDPLTKVRWTVQVQYQEPKKAAESPATTTGAPSQQAMRVLRDGQAVVQTNWEPGRLWGPLPAEVASWTQGGLWRLLATRGPEPDGLSGLFPAATVWNSQNLLTLDDQRFQVVDGDFRVAAELSQGVWTVWGEGDQAEALWQMGPALRLLSWMERQVVAYRTHWGPEARGSSAPNFPD